MFLFSDSKVVKYLQFFEMFPEDIEVISGVSLDIFSEGISVSCSVKGFFMVLETDMYEDGSISPLYVFFNVPDGLFGFAAYIPEMGQSHNGSDYKSDATSDTDKFSAFFGITFNDEPGHP